MFREEILTVSEKDRVSVPLVMFNCVKVTKDGRFVSGNTILAGRAEEFSMGVAGIPNTLVAADCPIAR